MGAKWVDPLWPDRYPTTPTWIEAIARSGDARLRPDRISGSQLDARHALDGGAWRVCRYELAG